MVDTTSPRLKNLKVVIAYDGGHYFGWQKTDKGQSVENCLQNTLEQMLQHPVTLQAASRTDRGVHARGQVANFFTPKTPFDGEKFRRSLNRLLPKQIVVLSIEEVDPSFHPTLSNRGKRYCYYLCYDSIQLPEHHLYSWHTPGHLDLEEMNKAAEAMLGSHDFSAFCNYHMNIRYTDYMRQVNKIEIKPIDDKRLCITVEGNDFLYKMVRNMIGTLVYVGRGRLSLQAVKDLFISHDRKAAGMTAPAHGLFLQRVFYS